MSLSIQDVANALKEAHVEPKLAREVIESLKAREADATEATATGPRAKNALTVILLDPEGRAKGDFTALVVQQPEEADAGQTLAKVYQAVYAHNADPKRKHTVKGVGEAADTVKRKRWKEAGLVLKTREPVRVLVSNNQIPTA